jgi:dethiobiotin synthetase
LIARARAAAGEETLIVEGVGGLLVPFADELVVRDLAVALGLPLLIAAGPGLGTINHTLLTLEAARRAGLRVAAVVLTPWPARPGTIERSNRETIARLGDVEVATLAPIAAGRSELLAAAGAALPLARWLSAYSS